MERQLGSYQARYKSDKKLRELSKEQRGKLTEIIIKGVEDTPIGKEFDISYFMRLIRPAYAQEEELKGINLGIGEIGHCLVAMDNIKWINCQCGGVGKFRKEYE